jgi:hypothetical protein
MEMLAAYSNKQLTLHVDSDHSHSRGSSLVKQNTTGGGPSAENYGKHIRYIDALLFVILQSVAAESVFSKLRDHRLGERERGFRAKHTTFPPSLAA